MIWFSFALSGLGLLIAALIQWRVIAKNDDRMLRPVGMDLAAKSFLDSMQSDRAPVMTASRWAVISVIIDVGGPVLGGRMDLLNTWLQRMLALNYCIIVPILLGCYVYLARSLREITGLEDTGPHRRRIVGFVVLQTLICTVALASQYRTILIQTTPATATPPIVWANPGTWRLNWQGAAHAALRGLDAVMALGLICTFARAWLRKKAIGGTELLNRRGTKVKFEIGSFARGSILITALASLVVWIHLATILEHRAEVSSEPPALAQFVTSGWALWVIGWIIASALIIDMLSDLYWRADAESRLKHASHDRVLWPIPLWLFLSVMAVSIIVNPIVAVLLPIVIHNGMYPLFR